MSILKAFKPLITSNSLRTMINTNEIRVYYNIFFKRILISLLRYLRLKFLNFNYRKNNLHFYYKKFKKQDNIIVFINKKIKK